MTVLWQTQSSIPQNLPTQRFAYFFCDCIQIKPDGVDRGLVGRIIRKFEEKGNQLVVGARIFNLFSDA